MKTNVLFFQKVSQAATGSTKAVWVYDLRANSPKFGKRTPLTREHFSGFEAAYREDANGRSARTDEGEGGRFRCFSREVVKARGDSLDISWQMCIRDRQWGVPPAELHRHLHGLGPRGAADFLNHSTRLLLQLAEVQELMGTAYMPILSQHTDELLAREQSWGTYTRPEDYLDSFGRFVREQINQSAALAVVVNAPKDLTRKQLREVRLLLDEHGFSEANLKAAWRNRSNLDIAASILGYIRQAALGEPLLPFEQRVANAMQRIYALKPWTPVQRKWLERLAKQLALEVVIDPAFVNRAFAQDGGARQLDKLLGGKLAAVMEDLAAHLWPEPVSYTHLDVYKRQVAAGPRAPPFGRPRAAVVQPGRLVPAPRFRRRTGRLAHRAAVADLCAGRAAWPRDTGQQRVVDAVAARRGRSA